MHNSKCQCMLLLAAFSLLLLSGCKKNSEPSDLGLHKASVTCLVEQYRDDGTLEIATEHLNLNQQLYRLKLQGNEWGVRYVINTDTSTPDFTDVHISFSLSDGLAKKTALKIIFRFEDWCRENYLLMPGTVYNGNRFRTTKMTYPPGFYDSRYHRTDIPVVTNDIHHLNRSKKTDSRIEATTGDLSVPAVGILDIEQQRLFLLFTQQASHLGNLGVSFRENAVDESASLIFTVPAMRDSLQTIDGKVPSQDKPVDWQVDDTVQIKFKFASFHAKAIPELFSTFCQYRNVYDLPSSLKKEIPFSSALSILLEKKNKFNWSDDRGLFSSSLGWVGGGMSTYAMIAEGDQVTRKRAMQNLSTILQDAPASSGLFNCLFVNGAWRADGEFSPDPEKAVLIRRNGDLMYFILKQLMLLEKMDPSWECPLAWENSIRSLADAFLDIWESYGQYGQWVNVETGEIIVGGSSAGSIIPAGLALASVYFSEDRYMTVAKATARYYYKKDVLAGYTTGGPGEILQAPDSESAFNMLESFIVLYETTSDKEWLKYAENMARQCATWVVAYDYCFPEQSTFRKLDIRTTGAVIANAQNMHASPGICTLSGDCLFKLFRATGDPFYLQLIRDIAHNSTQYLSREDRPVYAQQGNAYLPPGFMNERVNLSDWESIPKQGNNNQPWQVPVGEVFYGSTWAEDALMLTAAELPGIYIQTDTDVFCVLDNVNASMEKTNKEELLLKLENPTNYVAKVKIFIEDSKMAESTVLGPNHMTHLPVVQLQAGQQKTLLIRDNRLNEI